MSQRLVSPPEVPTAGIQEGMEGPEIQLEEDRKACRRKPHLLHGRVEERGREPVGALASPPGRGRPGPQRNEWRIPRTAESRQRPGRERPPHSHVPWLEGVQEPVHPPWRLTWACPALRGPRSTPACCRKLLPHWGRDKETSRRCTRCSYPHPTGAGWGPRGMVGPREKRGQGCGAAWTWRCSLCPERPIMSPLHPHYPRHGANTAGLGRDLAGQNHSGDTSPRVLISPGNL